MSKNYHVSKREDGNWVVHKENAARASSLHSTQAEAVTSARKFATRYGGQLTIHRSSQGSIPKKSPTHSQASSVEESTPLSQRIGERIARARTMRGLSLRSLSEQLDELVSHTTLQKIEKGLAKPDSRLLSALANILQVPPDYFFKKDQIRLQQVEYRKLGKLGKKQQAQLEEQASEFFERYYEIETILNLSRTELPHFDLTQTKPEHLGHEIEKAASELRKSWKLGRNPIPDVHLMLENHGVKVKLLPDVEGFDGFSSRIQIDDDLQGTMALSQRLLGDLPRLRLTALHELGHLVIDFPPALEHREVERHCHRFGASVLIPKQNFTHVFGQNRTKIATAELKAIKSEWGLSCAAIMARAKNLELISPSRYKTFCILSRKWKWHLNEPGEWIGNEISNRFEPLVLRALAEERISTSKAAGLLKVSLPELGAKFDLID